MCVIVRWLIRIAFLQARHLDTDLQTVMKAAESDFDWQRVSFVLEAVETLC